MFNTADILKARAVLFTLELPLRSERMYFIAFKMLSKTKRVVGNNHSFRVLPETIGPNISNSET